MDNIQILGKAMKKFLSGKTLPMNLEIYDGSAYIPIRIPRDDVAIQEVSRLLVRLMLEAEVGKVKEIIEEGGDLLKCDPMAVIRDYSIRVRNASGGHHTYAIQAHSIDDAKVIAFILDGRACPNNWDPATIVSLARDWTELMS